jgi:abequosyltransferase
MPTYNYGRYIAAAIESIRKQASKDIEVIVLDGGSTDETEAVVTEIARSWAAVRFYRQPVRGGIDRDLARSVELATGEFCWLLSADDALQEGALRRILQEIDSGSDLLLCNRIWCDASLKPVRPQHWLKGGDSDRGVRFAQAAEAARYFADARSLGALFSFMSCIGFRRETWLRAKADASLVGTNYAHVQRLFSMGRMGACLKYIAEPLVLCRGGMDSFRAGGLAGRLLIDLRGFLKLSQSIYPESEALQIAFREVLRREHLWQRWVRARSETRDAGLWNEVERALAVYGFGPIQLRLISAIGAMLGLERQPFVA